MSMRSVARFLVCAVTVLAAVPLAATDALDAHLRGSVADASGAVLPGVSVTLTTPNGATLQTLTTDEHGMFSVPHLASPRVTLTLQLDGFATKSIPLDVKPGVEAVLTEVMTLAPRTETIVVRGAAPVEPVRITTMPKADPMPVVAALPAHDRDSVCGPSVPQGDTVFGHVRASKDDPRRQLYSQGDLLLIDANADAGFEVGRNYVVRRTYRVRGTTRDALLDHSAGVVQIVSVDERRATAAVVYACDVFMRGDALAAFAPEKPHQPEPFGTPAFDDAARIVLGDAGQQLGSARRLMVIDRGTDANLHAGQTLTLFRRHGDAGDTASIVGAAMIVAVREHSATIRVDQGRDAIDVGDWAAPQRYDSGVSEPLSAAVP